MNRRFFLRRLVEGFLATAAVAVVDPEELLWRPGARTIFLPPEKKLLEARFMHTSYASGRGHPFVFQGDLFTIDGVYATNPLTKNKTRELQQFVITEHVSNARFGQEPLIISPAAKNTEVVLGGMRVELRDRR